MKTIWINRQEENIYAEFRKAFCCHGGEAVLRISASRGYAAFINGHFVSNAQYSDMAEYKVFDEIDIAPFLQRGENMLHILAYHWDRDFSTARVLPASVAFEISGGGAVLAQSDENTLVRVAQGYRKLDYGVTPQLGYGYGFDFCDTGSGWEQAVEVKTDFAFFPRPIQRLTVKDPCKATVCAQGVYRDGGGKNGAEKAMNAWLKSLRFSEMTGKSRLPLTQMPAETTFRAADGDGMFLVFDLGQEMAGYLSFSVVVPEACDGIVVWGEHLGDLRVRARIGDGNFATEFRLKAGKNEFNEYLHRLGGRYLCLFVASRELRVEHFGLREAVYPFRSVERKFEDRLLQKIYDTAVRTLELCVHEHYEDCPWREQALYGMDARNQMLYGYSAFREYRLPRAMLRLFIRSARESGLVECCAPSVGANVIPSFTLYILLACAENAEADYNEEFVKEILPYGEKAIGTFLKRKGEYGLTVFTEKGHWNFHEWSDGLDGGEIFRDYEIEPCFDGPLTALCSIVLKKLACLEEKAGRSQKAAAYLREAGDLDRRIGKYRDEKTGLYYSFVKDGKAYGLHSFTQALYLLAEAVPEGDRKAVLAELKAPKHSIPSTLAALQLKYEAILKLDGDRAYCVDEVCRIFGKMLYAGATSLWETENGEAEFGDVGSLCHAWSAVPCWLLGEA